MFTASMSDAEKNEAYARLIGGKDPAKEVKLCYVTVRPRLLRDLP